jgi:hypothetical protein
VLDCSPKPFSRLLQAVWAFWYWGELGCRVPVALIWISPWPLGSGKLGTPFDRMQMEYLSAAALAVAFSADVCGPRLGRVFLQTWSAALYAGAPPLTLGVGPKLGRPLDPIVGSGKSVTPRERMQPENLTAIASAAADAPGLEQPEGEQPESARLAGFDEAWGDPPPHADNPSPAATRAANRAADRQRRRPLLNV